MSKELLKLIKDPKPYWIETPIFLRCRNLRLKLEELGFRHIGDGADRIVFKKKKSNYVIKIPYNGHGIDANYNEFFLSRKYPKYIAPCRLLGKSLIMRYLELDDVEWKEHLFPDSHLYYSRLPEELARCRDGWQVGRHPITKQLFYYDLN